MSLIIDAATCRYWLRYWLFLRKKPARHAHHAHSPPFSHAIEAMMCAARERTLVDSSVLLTTPHSLTSPLPIARHSSTIVRRFWFRYEHAALCLKAARERYVTHSSRSSSRFSNASS